MERLKKNLVRTPHRPVGGQGGLDDEDQISSMWYSIGFCNSVLLSGFLSLFTITPSKSGIGMPKISRRKTMRHSTRVIVHSVGCLSKILTKDYG